MTCKGLRTVVMHKERKIRDEATGKVTVDGVEVLDGDERGLHDALVALAAAEPNPTATMQLVARDLGDDPGWSPSRSVALPKPNYEYQKRQKELEKKRKKEEKLKRKQERQATPGEGEAPAAPAPDAADAT